MEISPIQLKRNGVNELVITWSDSSVASIPSSTLRKACPCAQCREDRGDGSHDAPLTASQNPPKKKSLLNVVSNTLEESCSLEEIWAVGNYAIGVRWGDGHDDGIYTYQYLKDLGDSKRVVPEINPS